MQRVVKAQSAPRRILAMLRRLARAVAERRRPELSLPRPTPYGVGLGLIVYLVIAALFLGRSIVLPGSTFPGHPGDAEQYMWYLGLFWHALAGGHNPFITRLMNYPYGMNLMWNTSILAESIALGPLLAVMNSAAAYNVWFGLNILAAGALAQQIFARLGVRQSLQIIGGCLVAMLPYITTQSLSHISLVTTAPLLVALLILTIVAKGQGRRPAVLGALLGLAAAVQFYTLVEVLVSFVVVLVLGLAVAALVDSEALRRVLRRAPPRFWIAAAAVFVVLAAPGLYELLLGPYRVFHSVQPPNVYVTDLFNFILPTGAFSVHIPFVDPANWFTGNFAEDNGYLGIPAILLLIWSLRRLWPQTLARILAWTSGVVALLSLGSTLHVLGWTSPIPLPWWLFDQLPFVKDLLPARLMLYADLAVASLLILGIEDWLRQGAGTGRRPLWWLAAVVATWLPLIPYTNSPLPQATGAFAPGTPVVRALRGQPTYVLTVAFPEVMQALQETGYAFPVANTYGHTANDAARLQDLTGVDGLLTPSLSPDVYAGIVTADLRTLHVRRLVFIPRPSYGATSLSPAALRALNGALGPPITESPDGVLVWRVR